MAIKSKNTLKTYFETGDIPTEPQFEDLIDSLRHLNDGESIQSFSTDASGNIVITLSDNRTITIKQVNEANFVRKGVDAHQSWNGQYLIFSFSDANNVDAISYNDTDNSFHFNADTAKTNILANANVHAGEFRIVDKNTRLARGNSNAMRIKTNHGYVDMGPQNTGWSHFSTDRANFYFNKGVHSHGDVRLYNKNTYMRYSDGAILENGVRVATQNWVNAFFVGTGSSAKAKDSDKLDGLDSSAFLRSNANDTFTGMLSVGSTNSRQAGIYGIYDSTKIGHIWSMGTAYKIAANGSNFGNMYGFAYKHTNNATGGTMAGGHQAVWCDNGNPRVAIGSNIWTAGDVFANGSYYYGDGKRIIQFSDGWLRINPSNNFTSGIYCGSGRLRTDGQFEVGSSGSKFKVTSGGTVTSAGSITSAGNVCAYSDKRLKEALKPVKESFLDKIDQLKPTYYQWKDKTKEQAQQLGFIAQDVMKVFPQWVQRSGDHYAMSYDKMGAVLAVKGIQELRAEIKSLKEELKELKHGITH
ncbi:tail fiber domain-containing protein [Aquimarina sp. D1M17]|uniref:tail fiber domain-containing protein n=1 Tax=Aquimarina acroporae TaxID=2937283 RepID=UPI0020BDE3CC|nr:tail fiber domain-containing protein [Aquimarina acroporae]MCK8523074.1 tail fiber domain-containing protein [Aquimarina acroporae]